MRGGSSCAPGQRWQCGPRLLREGISKLFFFLPPCAAAAALRLQGNALLQSADAFGQLANAAPPARQLAAAVGEPAVPSAMQAGLGKGPAVTAARLAQVSDASSSSASPAASSQKRTAQSGEEAQLQPHTPVLHLPVTVEPVEPVSRVVYPTL